MATINLPSTGPHSMQDFVDNYLRPLLTALNTQSTTAAAITGGTIDGTPIGQTARALGAFSSMSTGYSGTPPTDAYFYKSTTTTIVMRFQNANGTADYAFDGNSVFFSNYAGGDVAFATTAGTSNRVFYIASVERLRINATNAQFSVPARHASYTVATLPAGTNGMQAFASNGRKVGEGSGAGTGVLVTYSNGAWRRQSDETQVVA